MINPGNPVGAVLSEAAVAELICFAAAKGMVVLADEVHQLHAYLPWLHSLCLLAYEGTRAPASHSPTNSRTHQQVYQLNVYAEGSAFYSCKQAPRKLLPSAAPLRYTLAPHTPVACTPPACAPPLRPSPRSYPPPPPAAPLTPLQVQLTVY